MDDFFSYLGYVVLQDLRTMTSFLNLDMLSSSTTQDYDIFITLDILSSRTMTSFLTLDMLSSRTKTSFLTLDIVLQDYPGL